MTGSRVQIQWLSLVNGEAGIHARIFVITAHDKEVDIVPLLAMCLMMQLPSNGYVEIDLKRPSSVVSTHVNQVYLTLTSPSTAIFVINPLSAGVAYIRVFIFLLAH